MFRVVVTGIGALTPIGNNVSEFWNSLIDGKNGIDAITYFDVSESKYKLAAEIKDFNPLNIMDKSMMRKTDLFVQYAMSAVREAMNDSGIREYIVDEDLGVFFGSGVGGFDTFCSEHEAMLKGGYRKVSPQFIPKMIYNIAAGNIAIKYNAKGPNMAVSTACATSTTAIGEAYKTIKHGYAKAIICGGSEAAINPLAVAGFGNSLALSPSQDKNAASLPFDKRRNGFVLGEGAGALILEEYEHAIRRNAKIYAEVYGYGATCDAYHVTAPSPLPVACSKAIKDAMNGITDIDVSSIYFNAHGTGTPLNDKSETVAIKTVFGGRSNRLNISSIKSMTGHMLGAAGAVEAIAGIKALNESIIPPTINLNVPDEDCDLDYTPNKAKKADISFVLSNSLGFGGHNACISFKKI